MTTVLEGMNLSFWSRIRTEKFKVFAGEEGSYTTYDINRQPITNPATQSPPIDPISW